MTSDHQSSSRHPVFLLFTVFVTGASVLIIELVGSRVLAPFFGSGIYTWSALIAVTLAALSAGYYAGGRYADRSHTAGALYRMCLFAGLWTIVTPAMAGLILPGLSALTDIRLGILLASSILFIPNLALLGAVGPFVIRMLTHHHEEVGRNSGRVFAISTVGSLLAALFTGFYLVPNFGASLIFTGCGLALIVLAIAGNPTRRFITTAVLMAAAVIALVVSMQRAVPGTGSAVLLDDTSSYYGRIQVVSTQGYTALLVDGVGQNYISDNGLYITPYIGFLTDLPGLIKPAVTSTGNVLVIGLGAGQLPIRLHEMGYTTDVVEIDPEIGRVASEHFGYDSKAINTLYMDGRRYIRNSDKRYDYIYLDAFSSDLIAGHMLTHEAFTETRQRLASGGVLALNITSLPESVDIRSVNTTLQSVFSEVHAYVLEGVDDLSSIIFIAADQPFDIETSEATKPFRQIAGDVTDNNTTIERGTLLTDDYNPVSEQRKQVQVAWRRRMLNYLGDDLTWLFYQ